MRVVEAIDQMSSQYLERIVRSFAKDYIKKDEEGFKREIKNNVDTLRDEPGLKERLSNAYSATVRPQSTRILYELTLRVLLSGLDASGTEVEVIEEVQKFERRILEEAGNRDSTAHLNSESEKIFITVLEAALEDGSVSKDEMNLLDKLRKKLEINSKDLLIILARIHHFPKPENEIHGPTEIRQALSDMQRSGAVFYCNQTESGEKKYVIPSEIQPAVKAVLGIELLDEKFKCLLEKLSVSQLKSSLKNAGLWTSGSKEVLVERIIRAGIKPSEILDNLFIEELQSLCESLPGLKKSGLKAKKVEEIIEYFDELLIAQSSDDNDDFRAVYFSVFESLAERDEKNLMAQNLISKGRDVDTAFELATAYIFEQIFGHEIISQEANDHADGAIVFGKQDELLLWDNKSLSDGKLYTLPEQHITQFKRYIRDADVRQNKKVRCFLIVVPAVDPIAEINAIRLKKESGQDTDVAIITAADLKFLADNWLKSKSGQKLDLEVFNITRILDHDELKKRMKIFNS